VRKLKPYAVDRVHIQKHQVSVDLFFDRDDKVFFATVDLKKLTAPSLRQLKDLVCSAVDQSKPVVWKQWIEVTCSERPDFHGGGDCPMSHHSIEVEYRRLETGSTADGRTLYRPFTEDLDEEYRRPRQIAEPLAYAHVDFDRGESERRIPYTEDAWAAVKAVAAAIDMARDRVADLFKDGAKKLAGFNAARLLGAGEQPAQKRGAR
jgi:hypothetical protein